MDNLESLANQMNKLAKRLPHMPSENAKGLALHFIKGLTIGTPVDTSEALSNWQAGVSVPKGNPLPPYYVGIGGSTQDQSVESTVSVAEEALQAKLPGMAIYISNNAPHIDKINNTGAAGVPPGFIETIIGIQMESFVYKWQI